VMEHRQSDGVKYSEQAPLTSEGLERLARLFTLLASVTLPESSLDRESDEANRIPTDPTQSAAMRGLRSGQHG